MSPNNEGLLSTLPTPRPSANHVFPLLASRHRSQERLVRIRRRSARNGCVSRHVRLFTIASRSAVIASRSARACASCDFVAAICGPQSST